MHMGAQLADASRMRVIWLMCALACGCGKQDSDNLKNKVLAIRDQARACKDKACVSAKVEAYVDLTKDLSNLSDADSKFFGDLGAEIRTLEVKLDAIAKTPQRTKAPGFSVELPAGWETRNVNKPNVVLTAGKGSSLETMTTLAVMRGAKQADFNTQPACDALGADQAETFKGKLARAKLFDIGGGPACVLRVTLDKRDALIAFIPGGTVGDERDARGPGRRQDHHGRLPGDLHVMDSRAVASRCSMDYPARSSSSWSNDSGIPS